MQNNLYFLERPQMKFSTNEKRTTPKIGVNYFSAQKTLKTQPDERTTTNNVSRRVESGLESSILEQRLYWIDQLTASLKQNSSFEVQKMLGTLQSISATLKHASKNEIELNQKNKLLNKSTFENIQQKSVIDKLTEQQNHLKNDQQDQIKRLYLSQQDQQKLQKECLYYKQMSENQYKKIRNLEKRIEMMLEKNLSTHQDELRQTLGELIKSNEQLKRDLLKREKEIERLKELNQKLVSQNQRLSKKLESLKTNKIGSKSDFFLEQNNTFAFDPNQLPMNLEFRYSQLSSEQNDFLLDLVEHGSEVFTSQVMQLENNQKKDLINLVANQFISQREFSEKLNSIMSEFVTLISYRNIKDFQTHLSKAFKQVLQTDAVHFWIIDGMTSTAYTHDHNGHHYVALLTDGVFQKLVFENFGIQEPTKEEQLLYITENDKVFAKNFLLLPMMMNSKRPCGLIEIQNISEENKLDIQYYGLLINMLSKSVIISILNYEAIEKEFKYQELFHHAFIQMSLSKTKEQFRERCQESALQIFQIAQTALLFIENDYFNKNGKNYSLTAGCAYQVYKSGKQQIFTQITKHLNFDENVDISSILPVFIGPINQGNKIVAILEFILKRKKIQESHPFGKQIEIGFKINTLDKDAQKFYEIVNKAYSMAFKE